MNENEITGETLTEEQIVAILKENNSISDDESDREITSVSSSEVLAAFDKIFIYLEQNKSQDIIDKGAFKAMKKARREVYRNNFFSKKQMSLDLFVKTNDSVDGVDNNNMNRIGDKDNIIDVDNINFETLYFNKGDFYNHEECEVLRAEINNLKSQISSQDNANVESLESESNDNDNRPGKKRKVARRQIDQSDDDSETDEENARTEMKVILKMMPPELTLRYDEKFTNETNTDILRQLIPRLIASMKPRFSPSYKQINDWLAALHKHCRARLLYVKRRVIDKDNRRLHKNNRLSEDYDKTEVLNILKDTRYHSPEDSETDKEQPDAYQFSPKRLGYSHIFSTDGAINEGRNYDYESYCITSRHPKNALEWAYKTQNTPVDTDFSGSDTPAENRESQSQTDNNTQTEHND
ncbi:unnamed protein product [Rhizophagus irregularis]|nr:unnamed protein product [Rhizophagus irregularis]